MQVDRVNQFVLEKQHLAPGTQGQDVLKVVDDICALHATSATTPYLSLWSRIRGFAREQLDAELYETRRMIKAVCMRRTMHIVGVEDWPVLFQATKDRLWRSHLRQMHQLLVWAGVCQEGQEATTLARLQSEVADALAETGPSTVAELSQLVPELTATVRHDVGKPYEGAFSLGSRLVPGMCTLGTLVRARPRGSWRSNLYEYAALDDWLPGVDLEAVEPPGAQAQLVRQYLAAFGPATEDDVVWWTGFGKRETRRALNALGDEVTRIKIEGLEGGYLILAPDARRIRTAGVQAGAAINLLPGLDSYIMGYHDRRRFLDPEHHSQVFDRAGNAVGTAWVDGRVVGVWDASEGRVEVFVWDDQQGDALLAEARRVGRFIGQEAAGEGVALDAVVKPYPPSVAVKYPFHLVRRG